MRPLKILTFLRARNIVLLQLAALLVLLQLAALLAFFTVVRLSPDLSFSRVAERYIQIVAPWIYTEHFNRSVSAGQGPVVGYVNKHSIEPGEHFSIALSTSRGIAEISGVLEVYRVGYYGTDDRKLVFRSDQIVVRHQVVSVDSFAIGAPWKHENIGIPTANWSSGYYTFDFVIDRDQRVLDIAYIVVRDRSRSGDVLVKLSTNTYQAYNKWGGGSLYLTPMLDGGVRHTNIVSFDRPTPTHFYRWEYYYVRWLERYAQEHRLRIGYATNHDLHAYPDIANNYTLLISLGHDEYWSQREFDAHYKRIFEQGKNTLFLSANTAFWRVRYANVHHSGLGRQMLCYKARLREGIVGEEVFDPLVQSQSPVPATGRCRGAVGYPEMMLMGVSYESWFSLEEARRFGYKIKTALPWLVEGTGLQEGDWVADVVGYEWDNTSLKDEGVQAWFQETAKIPYLPRENLTVVMEGHPVDINGQQGLAQAVYFESDAGAKVFSAGTIRWAWGLGKPLFKEDRFVRLNENLLAWFLATPKRPLP